MNTNCKIMALTAGLWAIGMAAGAQVASSEEQIKAANIAVVDVEHLMRQAAAAKSARAQVARMRAGFQLEIKGKMEAITKAYKKVVGVRSTVSEDAYKRRLLDLRKEAADYQTAAIDRHGKLDGALSKALDEIAVTIERVVDRIIKERKLALVLPRSGVIGRPEVHDITGEVLKRLDRRMPSVAVDVPK